MLQLQDAPNTSLLKKNVTDREGFVDDQDIRIHVYRDGECETNKHTAGVGLYWAIDEITYFGKLFNQRDPLASLGIREPEDGGVEVNILATRELRIKTCPEFEERRHAASNHNAAGRGADHARNHS